MVVFVMTGTIGGWLLVLGVGDDEGHHRLTPLASTTSVARSPSPWAGTTRYKSAHYELLSRPTTCTSPLQRFMMEYGGFSAVTSSCEIPERRSVSQCFRAALNILPSTFNVRCKSWPTGRGIGAAAVFSFVQSANQRTSVRAYTTRSHSLYKCTEFTVAVSTELTVHLL